jgi:hypothetical protein
MRITCWPRWVAIGFVLAVHLPWDVTPSPGVRRSVGTGGVSLTDVEAVYGPDALRFAHVHSWEAVFAQAR